MKKLIILSLLIFLAITSYASERLDSIFHALAGCSGVTTTKVKYSGGFSKDCQGFFIQRGDGAGWTKGERLAIKGITSEEALRLLKAFDNSSEELDFVLGIDNHREGLDQNKSIAYAGYFMPDKDTFFFLRAEVEDEVCIPKDWPVRDYYYAPVTTSSSDRKTYIPYPKSINWQAALATLHTELKYNSPFYSRNASEIDSTYYATLEESQNTDNYESFRLLRKLAASCKDGHTYIYGTNKDCESFHAAFSTVLLGNRVFIRSVDNEELEKKGINRGMEIIAVNSESPRDFATRELLPYISTSTPQWADHIIFDGYGLSNGRKNSELTLTISSDGGKHSHDVTVIRDCKSNAEIDNATSNYSFRVVSGNIGLLTLKNFASSDVRNFFDSIYRQLLSTNGLVIDLRGNGGGNSGHADYILSHLTTDSIATDPWTTPLYKPAFASWGMEPEVFESPSEMMAPVKDKTPYLNPVVVLIDRATFSAAEDFCSLFRGMGRGMIIGTPSAGSTGNGVRVQLTKDIWANICSKHDRMPDGTEFVGIGIIPDIIIEETPESYFSLNRDIVLDKATSAIR